MFPLYLLIVKPLALNITPQQNEKITYGKVENICKAHV